MLLLKDAVEVFLLILTALSHETNRSGLTKAHHGAVVVLQLVEPDIHGSNPVIGKIYMVNQLY